MRAKELLSFVPVPTKVITHAYSRITLTKFTVAYCIIAFIHAILQVGFQLGSSDSNGRADRTLSELMKAAAVEPTLVPIITPNDNGQDVLQLCNGIPSSRNDDRCETLVVPSPTLESQAGTATAAATPTAPAELSVSSDTEITSTIQLADPTPTESVAAVNEPSVAAIPPPAADTASSPDQTSVILLTPTIAEATQAASTAAVVETTAQPPAVETTIGAIADANTTTQPPPPPPPPPPANTQAEQTALEITITFTSIQQDQTTTSTTAAETTAEQLTTTTASAATDTSSVVTTTEALTTTTEETTTSSSTLDTTTLVQSTTETSQTLSEISTSSAPVVEISTISLTSPTVPSVAESTPAPGTVDEVTALGGTDEADFTLEVTSPTAATDIQLETVPATAPVVQDTAEAALATAPAVGASVDPTVAAIAPIARLRVRSAKFDQSFDGLERRTFNAEPIMNPTSGAVTGIKVTDLANNGSTIAVNISLKCAQALTFAEEALSGVQNEDLVMVGFHIWVFGISFAAVMTESIPHVAAAFLMAVLAVVYNIIQMTRTRSFQVQFKTFIIQGACDGTDVLPAYWAKRTQIEVPSLFLNCIFTLVLGCLAFKLYNTYARQTDKRMSGSGIFKHLYKIVLTLSVVIQMGAFMLIASFALWVAQLFQNPAAAFSGSTTAFKGIGILSVLAAIPWAVIGWIAVRKEHNVLMIVFLVMNVFFLGSWIAVFSSDVYRLVFSKWPFFAAITVSTFFLLVVSLTVGILYRLHFGQGLASQLAEKTQEPPEITPWEFNGNTEKAWEPFDMFSVRESSVRHSEFDYGIGSPNPPQKKVIAAF